MASIKKRYLGGGALLLLLLFILWGTVLAPLRIDWVETITDKSSFSAPPYAVENLGPDEAALYVFSLFSGPGLTDLREGEIIEVIRSMNLQRRVPVFLQQVFAMNVGTEDMLKTLFQQWDQYLPDDETLTWKVKNFFLRASLQPIQKARNSYPLDIFMYEMFASYGLSYKDVEKIVQAYNLASGLDKNAINPAMQQHFSRVITARTPRKLSGGALQYMKVYLAESKIPVAEASTYQEAIRLLNQ
ncbi:MAG: hypothetical protein AAGH79_03500 [Bacteroidota bacterium]